ncbi:IS982 family transposase [Flavobacterium sp.]|uniref:IS982 family transposase n=1 Tax=Flavobacterium sp. TaxID=239 RepID=UPI003BB9296C
MHNLKSNYDKFFHLIEKNFSTMFVTPGNFKFYPNAPKMSDASLIALTLSAEATGIDSENYFWHKLKSEHQQDFPTLIERSRFNRRRKILAPFIQLINERLAALMNEGENFFLVDSIPIPVCQKARASRSKICKEQFETSPDMGFSAVSDSYYYGYKLHLVTSIKGIFQSMDMTKASMHDVKYLSDIKYSSLNNCTLIADKGYLSAEYQADLFSCCNIRLKTPQRTNQKNFRPFPAVFKRCRKRIETLFSQLCDQMMLKRNYAKSFVGAAIRILSKITAVTFLQFLNFINHKPLNHLKYALCS